MFSNATGMEINDEGRGSKGNRNKRKTAETTSESRHTPQGGISNTNEQAGSADTHGMDNEDSTATKQQIVAAPPDAVQGNEWKRIRNQRRAELWRRSAGSDKSTEPGTEGCDIGIVTSPGTTYIESNDGGSTRRIECGGCTTANTGESHTDMCLRDSIYSGTGLEAAPDTSSGAVLFLMIRRPPRSTHTPTPRGPRSPAGKRRQNQRQHRQRRAALERRALKADVPANEDATQHPGCSH
jgi:hypothetical protein